jgi:hypothetical protein
MAQMKTLFCYEYIHHISMYKMPTYKQTIEKVKCILFFLLSDKCVTLQFSL